MSSIEELRREAVRELSQAARRVGKDVSPEGAVLVAQSGITFVAAPVEGLETVPATRYAEGVDFAVAYVDLAAKNLEPGFYTLRGVVYEVKLGEVPARVDLVDAAGRVAASLESTAEIESLAVPESPPVFGVAVSAQIHFPQDMTAGMQVDLDQSWWCSNGVHILSQDVRDRNELVPM